MHHHIFSFLHNRELDELYASFAIRSFAISLVSVFVPIYLLKLNFSLSSVLFYYIAAYIIHTISIIPAAKLSAKFGFKHIILFSLPLLIIFFLLLYSLPQYNWPLPFLAIFSGLNLSLFWVGFHIDFATFSDKKHRGEEVGMIRLITSAFQAIGPIVGGLIITFLGFKSLFVTVSVVLIAAAIPLFLSKDIHTKFDFKTRNLFKGQKLTDAIALVARGMERGMGIVIWPMIIFFNILNSYTALGTITTLTLVFSLAFTFIIGKAADKKRGSVLKFGAIFNSIVWLTRTFVRTSLQVFIIDSFYGMSKTMYLIPFDASDYDKANKSNIVRYIIFRQLMVSLGLVGLFTILYFIGSLTAGPIIGAGASLLILLF